MPFEAANQRTGELFVRHAGGPPPEVLYQTRFLVGKAIAVLGEGALEVLPRLPQKV